MFLLRRLLGFFTWECDRSYRAATGAPERSRIWQSMAWVLTRIGLTLVLPHNQSEAVVNARQPRGLNGKKVQNRFSSPVAPDRINLFLLTKPLDAAKTAI